MVWSLNSALDCFLSGVVVCKMVGKCRFVPLYRMLRSKGIDYCVEDFSPRATSYNFESKPPRKENAANASHGHHLILPHFIDRGKMYSRAVSSGPYFPLVFCCRKRDGYLKPLPSVRIVLSLFTKKIRERNTARRIR